ncbi:ubiD operon protein [Natrialbaceae archaeon GCM10025810]|uniref:ubiD operon protein n=1 Tax=Halovalidus salilacus TaxID=3075124 RepID=UPI0036217A38
MSNQYITAEEHLPEAGEGETVLQIRDAETKKIFRSQVRIAKDADRLEHPEPLSVVKGPHENTREQWYVEFVDEREAVEERLERLLREQREESNVLNTRSADLKVLLRYLVETGEYDSTAEAARDLLLAQFADEYPSLLETYAECKVEFEPDPLRDALEARDDGERRDRRADRNRPPDRSRRPDGGG